eukprot:TRINITY_DN24071_c0_g1_i3.p1 TRINITY_DN24071_c0_g1~~TRINITY_DN24071_c0_g1_i3.p1  ORF type:complete len:314 (-),score=10.04 TRINITY_DN24071_c0_g1_i3:545-1486(-)
MKNLPSAQSRISTIWGRIKAEYSVELELLKKKWKVILLCAMFQYVHGMFTQLAYRLHRPQAEPLHDMGFEILPELGKRNEWVSETLFALLMISFVIWTFSPFWLEKKRFFTVILYTRMLFILVVCQCMRIITFLSTQLPGCNYHCLKGQPTDHLDWPEHWWGFFVVDVQRQSTHSCGDLIFSSHTTFILMIVLTYTKYGEFKYVKMFAWALAATLSLLIISSHKHYSVDVLIAWYVVPLVFFAFHRRWQGQRQLAEEEERLYKPVNSQLEKIIIASDSESSLGYDYVRTNQRLARARAVGDNGGNGEGNTKSG